MKIKEAYDFLSNNAKRVEYDNKQAQQKRDAQRWAAYQVFSFPNFGFIISALGTL